MISKPSSSWSTKNRIKFNKICNLNYDISDQNVRSSISPNPDYVDTTINLNIPRIFGNGMNKVALSKLNKDKNQLNNFFISQHVTQNQAIIENEDKLIEKNLDENKKTVYKISNLNLDELRFKKQQKRFENSFVYNNFPTNERVKTNTSSNEFRHFIKFSTKENQKNFILDRSNEENHTNIKANECSIERNKGSNKRRSNYLVIKKIIFWTFQIRKEKF